MTKKNNPLKEWSLSHPFVLTLSIIVIAYAGYLFGNWLYDALH